ncbi:MAG: hypothetical protein ACUVXB_10340 [Bryobacteraceae bacterium]
MIHPTDYQERMLEVSGWPVRLGSYRLGERYYCRADNVSPGAWLARTTGQRREEAETKAMERAQQLLSRTRRIP